MTLLTDKKLVKKEPKYGIQIRCAVQRHWAAVPVLDVKRDAPNLAILKVCFIAQQGQHCHNQGKHLKAIWKHHQLLSTGFLEWLYVPWNWNDIIWHNMRFNFEFCCWAGCVKPTILSNAWRDHLPIRTQEVTKRVRERPRAWKDKTRGTQYPVLLAENPADVLDQHSPCGGCHFEAGGLLCARACRVLSRYLLLEAKECWSLSSPNCQKLFQHSQTISDVSKSDQE